MAALGSAGAFSCPVFLPSLPQVNLKISEQNESASAELFKTFPFLENILKSIPQFQGDISTQFLDFGIANYVFKVSNHSSGKSYALKVYREKKIERITKAYQSFDALRSSFLANGIQTPATVVFPFLVDDKLVMVNDFLDGEHITDKHLPAAAEIMAKLHSIEVPSSSLNPRFDMNFFFEQCSGWEHCAALKSIWDSLDLNYLESLPQGLIHGDFSYSNILVDGKGHFALIDFDKMRYAYLLDDLALAQIYYGFDQNGDFKKEAFASFMAAYQKIRPLTAVEKDHLVTHTTRCLIEIAMVMRYYLYVNPNGPIPGVAGDPEQVDRIRKNWKNHYIDPDFMQKGIQSLVGLKEKAWLELPPRTYQDVFVNGTILAKGNGPDCASRYEAIKPVLGSYTRPFTILDIGASEGYFPLRAISDYDATAVMIEDPVCRDGFLQKLCAANTDSNQKIDLRFKKVTADELAELAENEHFDVVLAMNVIHHFDADWNKAYEAIKKLGDNIIIETPPDGDRGACGQSFIAPINARIDGESYVLLGRFKRHTDPDLQDRLVWVANN